MAELTKTTNNNMERGWVVRILYRAAGADRETMKAVRVQAEDARQAELKALQRWRERLSREPTIKYLGCCVEPDTTVRS